MEEENKHKSEKSTIPKFLLFQDSNYSWGSLPSVQGNLSLKKIPPSNIYSKTWQVIFSLPPQHLKGFVILSSYFVSIKKFTTFLLK